MADVIRFGPFTRCVSAVEPHVAPPETMANGQNMLVDPVAGGAFKRNGCVTAGYGESLNASTKRATNGIMESAPEWVPYRLRSFFSPSLVDGVSQGAPTPSILYGKEATSTSWPTVDDGVFGQEYVLRGDANYNLLKEFGSTAYPTSGGALGTQLYYKVVPFWYESGEGGYSRGAFEFARRFVASGSWGTVDAGRWRYYPNLRGTPLRWDGGTNAASNDITSSVRVWPTGPFAPLWAPTITANDGSGTARTATRPWLGGDTFYLSVLFQFEDGSYSLPTYPVLRTLNSAALTTAYASVTIANIPRGPEGVVARILVRSPKQTLTATTDPTSVDISDMRILGVLRNNEQTSYTDTLADDDGLLVDTDVVRWDLICPPRARHIGTGDQRVLVGYTLPNPAAIMLTCAGISSDYDQNAYSDSNSGLSGSTSAVYRVVNTGTAATSYVQTAVASGGTLTSSTQWTFNTYTTLQALVDAINASTTSTNGEQWKAQVAPGADPNASTMDLCATVWVSTSSTSAASTTLTLDAATVANIPIGYKIHDTAVGPVIPADTYITAKTSTTQVTMSAAASGAGAAAALYIYADTGDTACTSGEAVASRFGWIRVFAHQVPGMVYFKRTAMPNYDKPNKDRVYFTISSPGAAATGVSIAANAFGASNRRDGVNDPGQVMGIVDVEGAAVIAYRKKIGLFINLRGANTAEDFDYRILTINGSAGCISPWSVVGANGCAVYATATGIKATDKSRREIMLSDDIYNASRDKGDLAYEIPRAAYAAARDIANCWLGGCVWGNRLVYCYRRSASTYGWSVYDFTPGADQNGLDSLANPETRKPYGWSTMCQLDSTNDELGPRAVGAVETDNNGYVLFGAINDNYGTNDGRIDKLMYPGQATDNGENIIASFETRRLLSGAGSGFKAKAWTLTHKVGYANATWSHIRLESGATESTVSIATAGSNDVVIERLQINQLGRTRGKAAQGYFYDATASVGGVVWFADLELRTIRTLGS